MATGTGGTLEMAQEHRAVPFFLIFSALLSLSLYLLSCSSETTPQEIAAEFISHSKDAFEERDILSLRKLISPNYRDTHKRSANDVVAIAAAYIRSSKSIYLFSDLDTADYDGERIRARVLIAFAARPVTDRSALGSMQADIYWFDIVLVEEDGAWKLAEAQWQQALIEDFL